MCLRSNRVGRVRMLLLATCLAFSLHVTAAQKKLPEITIGDPNDITNDILGSPLSEKEFEESLNLNLSVDEVKLEEDPISQPKFFEGDIIVESEDILHQIIEGDPNGQLSAVTNPYKIWPNGVIPYVISSSFGSSERSLIARAMAEFHSRTCIRFTPRNDHRNYIHILRGQGCSSAVGRSGGYQIVSLGNGCVQFGVILHELMHATGFWHEQSRYDRDSYVTIYWNNILPGLSYNFDKKSNSVTSDLGLSYDYNSIMHYGPYAFSRSYGYQTIAPKLSGYTIGQRKGFSELDVKGLNLLYKCSGVDPKPDPGPTTTCTDNHVYCTSWASSGFCSSNYAFMVTYCKKSCNFCDGNSCGDIGAYCADWATKGECQKNSAYMSTNCRRSCKLCGTSSTCRDENVYCEDWSKKGECTRNPAYMNESCAKACGKC